MVTLMCPSCETEFSSELFTAKCPQCFMEIDTIPTKVIFRFLRKEREVVALFPEIAADPTGKTCSSYVGDGYKPQDLSTIINASRPAFESEYQKVQEYLVSKGYLLDLRKKITPAMNAIRKSDVGRRL